MLDKNYSKELSKELKDADERREKVIQLSRDIIKESKIVIYSLQRGEKTDLKRIQSQVKNLKRESQTGIEDTAIQEYVEAACFYSFLEKNKIPTHTELEVDIDSYLMGLSDLTGELLRKAVKDVIEHKYDDAKKITSLVEEIYGLFLQLDLRNGPIRQKADSIKWNLQKLEHLVLDISRK